MSRYRKSFLAFACLTVVAARVASAAPEVLPLPVDWYPESVAVGPHGNFYVGSWRQGAVARVRPGGVSKVDVLVKPGSNGLANGQGVLVDAKRNALWVCSGSSGFTTVPMTPSALKRYDLATGEPTASYAMPDNGYCNDLAQDRRGNIYVTDSFYPRILRLATRAQSLSIWKEDVLFAGPEPLKGLNGIAIDGNSVYVSLVAAAPYLLRVGLTPGGEAGAVTRIDAPRVLRNVDAIRAWKPGKLVLFESNVFGGNGPYGGQITIARVEGDRVQNLHTVVAGLNDPSSGVVVGNHVYFIESKYLLLTQHKDDDAAIPRGVPFNLQSRKLSAD